jgi:sugar phosphate isomerase/epimerase
VRSSGYGAAYAPCPIDADDATVAVYRRAAKERDIVIAEVGAWSNPISPHDAERRAAEAKCIAALAHAERLGAVCAVNIAGSRNPDRWDGPHPDNLSRATFDLVVESVRLIIDAVKPARSFYTLETMPWVFPDSADSYLELIRAIDRPSFGVHFDPVNLVSSPRRLYDTGAMIREFWEKLGPWIKSVHAKDVRCEPRLTFHVDECRPGQGALDYGALLRGAERHDPDMPVLLEHLPNEQEYELAADFMRGQAAAHGVSLR